ncbi:MAG: NAD(P)/FAD-dependent oxidoreductase [Candidatus Nezhaarchaeota archaeon]|nr:NAD(P)/FAD-dependent oxidoreductase [Candidatus Nezhaarchaeota archaeon]
MTYVDVLVVGAGPTGLLAAIEAAREGAEVLILEEHSEVGKPAHCAGLVSVDGLRMLRVHGDFIQGWANGAILHSPGGTELRIDAKKRVACIIDREAFDKRLAEEAINEGAELLYRARALEPLREWGVNGVRAKVNGRTEIIKSKVVVDAEGARFKLSKLAGLPVPEPSTIYPAAQLEFKGGEFEEGFVELFFNEKWAPGFFAWAIPFNGGCKIGLASSIGRCRELLLHFTKKNPKVSARLRQAILKKMSSGLLVLGGPLRRTYADGIVLVGDVAGHTKPTTGGGLVFGGLAAKVAGKEAAAYSVKEDAEALKRYEQRWRRLFGKELERMKRLRGYLSLLGSERCERLFRLAKLTGLERAISKVGDMDLHAQTALRLALEAKLAPLLGLFILEALAESLKRGRQVALRQWRER